MNNYFDCSELHGPLLLLFASTICSHATFLGLLPDEQLLTSFKVSRSELPALYLLAEGGDSLVPFGGEVLEASITEWVLRHSLPGVDELSFARPSGNPEHMRVVVD